MSHNVESIFYVREKPWHGLGTMVAEAPTSADAIRLAGLDWDVKPKQVYDDRGFRIPGYIANTRSSDGKVLGIVTDRYRIVQNSDAFAFTDSLIGGEVHYETAGSLCGGRKVWLLAKLGDTEIAGDKVEPYVCFTNTHDGSGSVRVCMTPVRVVCNNTLNLALSTAQRQWSVRHTASVEQRVKEARDVLGMADIYLKNLAKYADKMANVTVNTELLETVLNKLFPVRDENSEISKRNAETQKEQFIVAYNMPDIKKFYGTAWGVINAAADMAGHAEPLRRTKNFDENRFDSIVGGSSLLDSAAALVGAAA